MFSQLQKRTELGPATHSPDPGARLESGCFHFKKKKKAQPPGKTTGSHRQPGDWQGPFNFEGLSACTGAQPGLGATALSLEKQMPLHSWVVP